LDAIHHCERIAMTPFSTCDLCDAHEDRLLDGRIQIVAPGYLSFGRWKRFHGPAFTLVVHEDNALVREAVQQSGHRRVLVVDGGGSRDFALLGGNLANFASANGWAGVIVHGAVRDADELNEAEIGVRALVLQPRRARKEGAGRRDVPVQFGDVRIAPGAYIYADADGIIVSTEELTLGAE
jgi:regulator of ribonuclease activity A